MSGGWVVGWMPWKYNQLSPTKAGTGAEPSNKAIKINVDKKIADTSSINAIYLLYNKNGPN